MSTIFLTCYVLILMSVLISQVRCGTSVNHVLHHEIIRKGHGHLHAHHKNARCSRCSPGWGVVERCTPSGDTLCEVCPPGTYSPHHSAVATCWLCSRCGPGLYEAHPCTRRADTLCDRCSTVSGPHNGDFSVHCNMTAEVQEAVEFATEMLAPPSSARRAILPNLAAEPSVSKPTERQNDAEVPVQQESVLDTEAADEPSVPKSVKGHVTLGAALIVTLQTMLLVSAGGASCLLARRLRSSTCLRHRENKEHAAQEETLLQEMQEMKPRVRDPEEA